MTAIGVFKFRPPLGFWLAVFAVLAALYIAWGIQNNSFKALTPKASQPRGKNLVIVHESAQTISVEARRLARWLINKVNDFRRSQKATK
jgi:hypothetical protein